MSHTNEQADSQWCFVGNIVDEHACGEGGTETKRGTKHFSPVERMCKTSWGPGTKVYCLPAQWGDGYEQIKVIGRHRGSKQFKTMVIPSKRVTNWRAKVVYNPEVMRRLRVATSEDWLPIWKSQEEVESYVATLRERENAT